ncbi:hypothetical protein GTP45_03305 [Pseudoduganella sp. FT55W]|uniref:Uncharacterized protein n=1 Tax=Duganella rivi TaxID=2666083 RepID=A0A7X4GLW4_9BURK|nr:hypothetical protein [Duganella rivi]MYM65863.1 hypothetical protein [Duganella rivi]
MKLLNMTELQRVYASGDISSVTLFADGDVFEVRIITADGVTQLAQDDGVAIWRDPGEVLLLLKQMGIANVNVDTAAWRPNLRLPTHDEWVTRKVEASLTGLKDGSNRVFSAEEWAAIRAAKKVSRGAS